MDYISNILLGQITKVSGFEGAVAVKLERSFTEEIPDMESVFLEIEGRPVPFFIEYYEYSGGGILKLKFEDYDTPEEVSGFTGCRVFLTESVQTGHDTDEFSLLGGYKILSSEKDLIGTVEEIIQNPGQMLLSVRSEEGKTLLIPLHEDFIVNIDKKRKILVMNLPEGLTDIN